MIDIGGISCVDTMFTNSGNTIECKATLAVGDYSVYVAVRELGCASIPNSINTVTIHGEITNFSPTGGSIEGYTRLTIYGYRFSSDSTVNMNPNIVCDVTAVTSIK